MKKLLKDFIVGLIIGIPLSWLVEISTVENFSVFLVFCGILGIMAGLPNGNYENDWRSKYRPG